MAIVQKPKRVTTDGLTEEASIQAVESVGDAINGFLGDSYDAMMGFLTITDNLDQEFKDITTIVDANGLPQNSLKFNVKRNRVNGMLCVRVLAGTAIAQPFPSFVQNGNVVEITHIAGLTAGVKYRLILLIIGR
jgi:hypothetical protein